MICSGTVASPSESVYGAKCLKSWWAVTGSNRRPSRCKRLGPSDLSIETALFRRERWGNGA